MKGSIQTGTFASLFLFLKMYQHLVFLVSLVGCKRNNEIHHAVGEKINSYAGRTQFRSYFLNMCHVSATEAGMLAQILWHSHGPQGAHSLFIEIDKCKEL